MTPGELNARIRRVCLVAFDVDGVLTDGALYVAADGTEMKVFHAHDGAGIRYLERAGLKTGILSGRTSGPVAHRARELGIEYVIEGAKLKIEGLRQLLRLAKATAEETCFVGDDLTDIPVMREVGLAVAVANARPEVKRVAHWTTRRRGGNAAVREVAERILKVQKKWGDVAARYGLDARGRPTEEAP